MEQLKYIIEDRTIAELLGVQNFTNKESAILELVKNSFDAKADNLIIRFNNNMIIIEDDGKGMDISDIKNKWMHVGISDKEYDVIDNKGNERILAGSKGVGRFALARLGSNIELYSKKENNEDCVRWDTDWNKSNIIEYKDEKLNHGTKIIINNLRDKWNEKSIVNLRKYLSRMYNDNLMKINIIFKEETKEIEKYFENPIIGYNCLYIIQANYDSNNKKLILNIKSDEFSKEAKLYCKDINLNEFTNEIDVYNELENKESLNLDNDELKKTLSELGDFSAEFYFIRKEALGKDVEKFLYKNKKMINSYEKGVILYRNSFSISSYESSKDWLGLSKRAQKSPAAATHPTGSWRVRENQLAGKILIDKKKNYMLKDLSNRQGLDENIYYETFIEIIYLGISEFERYRQDIIRRINKKNIEYKEKDKKIVDKILNNPQSVKSLVGRELSKFVSEIKEYKKENTEYKKEIDSTEKRYKYDIRILNVLATSGLKATSIAHEMNNDRNNITENCDYIIDALKEFELWDILNSEEYTKYAFSDVPSLLEKNREINKKMMIFMDTMLMDVEKKQFFAEKYNVFNLINEIKNIWERDYSWVNINLNIDESITFNISKDSIKVIFDNLILNSLQQNDELIHLNIYIDVILCGDILNFKYSDDGNGLSEKYKKYPMKILEVHESTRKTGHGLGMWMVNNTIVMLSGEVIEIKYKDKGFEMEFFIKEN